MYTDLGKPRNNKPPLEISLRDLTTIEVRDTEASKLKYVTFYHVSPHKKVSFGQPTKNKREPSFAEFNAALQRVEDEEIYPEIPKDITSKIAPDNLDGN